MKLKRYSDPFDMFDNLFDGFGFARPSNWYSSQKVFSNLTNDINHGAGITYEYDKDNNLVVTFNVAGFKKEDLEVTVENDQLVVVSKLESKQMRKTFHVGGLSNGSTKFSAKYESGLLVVTVAREESQRKLIEIL